jgi:hypothetical protein
MGVHPSSDESLDIFTSMLLLVHTNSSKEEAQETPLNSFHSTSTPTPTPTPSLRSTSNSLHIHLAHQLFTLTTLIPVRALLAVAGESWILDEKISSRTEFAKCQTEVRKWATASTNAASAASSSSSSSASASASSAVSASASSASSSSSATATAALPLALEILRQHSLHPNKTPFVFHEWSLHLAVLVVWAGFYAGRKTRRQQQRQQQQRLRLEVPDLFSTSSGPPMPGIVELDRFVAGLVNGGVGVGVGAGGSLAWQDAKALLMWAKGRLEKGGITRFCGVVGKAVEVLEALGERGDEDGWF